MVKVRGDAREERTSNHTTAQGGGYAFLEGVASPSREGGHFEKTISPPPEKEATLRKPSCLWMKVKKNTWAGSPM
jgi:hypothetical protein